MFWIILTVLALILITWTCYIRPYSHWKKMGVPQSNPVIFFGDVWPTLLRVKGLLEWTNWIYTMHPESKYSGLYQFLMPTFLVKDPELIKKMTVKDFDHFTDHRNFAVSEDVDPLWSTNLFNLKGQKWREMRSLLSRSFTSSKMKMISEEAQKFVNYFLKQEKNIQEVELKNMFTRYTNDVIASTSFGIKVDSLENPDNEFFLMGKEVSNFNTFKVMMRILGVMLFPWLFKLLRIGIISKRVRVFFTSIIDETIKTREKQGIVRPDMINLLLEYRRGQAKPDNEETASDSGFAVVQELSSEIVKSQKTQLNITNQDIAAQALIFFLAGFDSVAMAMCFTCYELALNPDIQEKLREEIKQVSAESKGKPTYEDLLNMKYLDMVLSESLRKWPIAPAADRVCVKPYTLEPTSPGEPTITFRRSDILWIPIYNIHHDPKYYPDPEKFIPDRFSEESKSNIIPYTYLPFGVGPRACVASRFALLEIKSVLFHLLNSFDIVPTENTQIPLKFCQIGINFTPEKGFQLGLKKLQT